MTKEELNANIQVLINDLKTHSSNQIKHIENTNESIRVLTETIKTLTSTVNSLKIRIEELENKTYSRRRYGGP